MSVHESDATTAAPAADEPVREELAFRFQHGAQARSLAEFESALRTAPPEVVHYHREHFVPWVRDVLRDKPLARRLEGYANAGMQPAVLQETLVDLVAARARERRTRA